MNTSTRLQFGLLGPIAKTLGKLIMLSLLVATALSSLALAATCPDPTNNAGYVRAGAAGSGSGADWTNAFTDIPSTLVRGCTYYIAAGTYPPHVFNTAVSGTSLITIQAPTVSNHGTSTGWSSSYVGQAVWQMTASGGPIWDVSQADYFVFNGSYCTSRTDYPAICDSGYGFKLDTQGYTINGNTGNDCELCGLVQGGYGAYGTSANYDSHDQIFEYIELYGSNRGNTINSTQPADAGFSFSGGSYDLLFSHNYVHNTCWQFFLRGNHEGGQSFAPGSGANITIQYSHLYWDGAGLNSDPNSPHGTPLDESEGIQDYTVRYNLITDMGGDGSASGGTSNGPDTASGADYNSGNGYGGPWYIYGNIWYSDNDLKCASGDGVMAVYDFSMTNGDVYLVNNTFANMGWPICTAEVNTFLGLGLSYTTPFEGLYEENNLFYQMDASPVNPTTFIANGATTNGSTGSGGGATFSPAVVHGYDAWFASPETGAADTGANAQVSSSYPFVSASTYNFNLATDTTAGVTLSNVGTYWNGSALVANTLNIDMNGVMRGANGTWDRGAIQRGGSTDPTPPTNPTWTVH